MSKKVLITLIFLLLISSGGYAATQFVIGTYQSVTEGYLVQFTLHNITINEVINAWSISTTDATSPVAPVGWTIYQNFREVEWSASTTEHQLQWGQSKSGFGFILHSMPDTLNWWVSSNRTSYIGTVTPTPAPVPELSPIFALAGGLASIGGFALRRRK